MNFKLRSVISVCTIKDIETFSVSSHHIVKNIDAENYRVVVPDGYVEYFKSKISPRFEVVNEQIYHEIRSYLESKVPKRYDRFGWYFQQLIKIAELNIGDVSAINLVWDADTVPLKNLIFEDNGSVLYFCGSENHQPYFDFITKILDLEKQTPYSFIAQSFPARACWVKEFCETLEKKFDKPWFSVIIDNIDFSEASGFSEYETLGTFIHARYPRKISFRPQRKWLRMGNNLIGGIDKLEYYLPKLLKKYDFISFENWDRKELTIRSILKRLKLRWL